MNWFATICGTAVLALIVWYLYFELRTEEWTEYAKLRLADNFWKVLNARDTFSDPLVDQFAKDLESAAEAVLSGDLSPVEFPSVGFVGDASSKLEKVLDQLTEKRHRNDSRCPEYYYNERDRLNAIVGLKIFEEYETGPLSIDYRLGYNFVKKLIIFKACGLSKVLELQPVPKSPFFPLEKIPKFFWNDSLRRHQELSGL